jgi:hypothetical protein
VPRIFQFGPPPQVAGAKRLGGDSGPVSGENRLDGWTRTAVSDEKGLDGWAWATIRNEKGLDGWTPTAVGNKWANNISLDNGITWAIVAQAIYRKSDYRDEQQ